MNLREAYNILKNEGYTVLKEWRYNEYSDIGVEPDWDRDLSGHYRAKLVIMNNERLQDASERIFNDSEFLFNVLQAYCYEDIWVTYYYYEKKDKYSDFRWAKSDTKTLCDNPINVMNQIEETASEEDIEYSKDYVNEHIEEICELLQYSLNYSLEYESVDFETAEFIKEWD